MIKVNIENGSKFISQKEIVLKDGQPAILVTIKYGDKYSYNAIECFVEGQKDNVGYINFKIYQDSPCDYAFIYKIGLCNKDYHSIGIGSALIKTFERFCLEREVKVVKGRYTPDGQYETHAKNFYDKHGYEIDENKDITKLLSHTLLLLDDLNLNDGE